MLPAQTPSLEPMHQVVVSDIGAGGRLVEAAHRAELGARIRDSWTDGDRLKRTRVTAAGQSNQKNENENTRKRRKRTFLHGLFLGPLSKYMERETGFEPATSTLARSHSTTELLPPSPIILHDLSFSRPAACGALEFSWTLCRADRASVRRTLTLGRDLQNLATW